MVFPLSKSGMRKRGERWTWAAETRRTEIAECSVLVNTSVVVLITM